MRHVLSRFSMSVLIVAVATSAGCQHAINPFHDEPVADDLLTTPSAEGATAGESRMLVRQRPWEPTPVQFEFTGTDHWPLWWEDPFVDKGDGNDTFAWTCADYVAMPYGPGRFILNTIAWPVSAVVTPPGTRMSSDGRLSKQALGYDHDAQRAPAPPKPADLAR